MKKYVWIVVSVPRAEIRPNHVVIESVKGSETLAEKKAQELFSENPYMKYQVQEWECDL